MRSVSNSVGNRDVPKTIAVTDLGRGSGRGGSGGCLVVFS